MKRLSLIYILIVLITIALVGCGKQNSANDGTTKANIAGATDGSTNPTQTAKSFLEAVRGRQYGEVREMLSQRSIANLNEAANKVNTNLDQALKRVIDQDAQEMAANRATSFETRNEEVHGERATVEIKATNAPEFARLSLIKESGRWKINIDETATAN